MTPDVIEEANEKGAIIHAHIKWIAQIHQDDKKELSKIIFSSR